MPTAHFHPSVLNAAQRRALRVLGPPLTSRGAYLGGGTAVALYLGHRRSEDLDWLTPSAEADFAGLSALLSRAKAPVEWQAPGKGALHGTLFGVRVSVLNYT